MRTILGVSLVAIWLGLSAGCVTVDAKAPSMDRSPPPATSSVTYAVDSDKADLLRENQQLRNRAAWLETENRKLADKSRSLDREIDELVRDIDRLESECDRFRREMER